MKTFKILVSIVKIYANLLFYNPNKNVLSLKCTKFKFCLLYSMNVILEQEPGLPIAKATLVFLMLPCHNPLTKVIYLNRMKMG